MDTELDKNFTISDIAAWRWALGLVILPAPLDGPILLLQAPQHGLQVLVRMTGTTHPCHHPSLRSPTPPEEAVILAQPAASGR